MLQKVKALWAVFKAGESVSDPKMWKGRQITTTILAGFLIALIQLAKAFGIEVPIDTETATAIAGAILTLVNVALTLCTSKSVGMRTPEQSVQDVQPTDAEGAAESTVPTQHQANAQQGIDAETRARAIEWAKQQESANANTAWRDGY